MVRRTSFKKHNFIIFKNQFIDLDELMHTKYWQDGNLGVLVEFKNKQEWFIACSEEEYLDFLKEITKKLNE